MSDDYTPEPYELRHPPHLIANEVLRRINGLLWEQGEKFQLSGRFHAEIEQLIKQYQDKLFEKSHE